ncbi:O-antigen ligase family protein [Mixta calida]|uniref:O-antigen ligase family protein n=1 Tax=Mixta calida TaxID=665913 RepID=UPI00403A841B
MLKQETIKKGSFKQIALTAAIAIIFLSLYGMIFNPIYARKFFYTAGYAIIILALIDLKKFTRPFRRLNITLAVLGYCLTLLVWFLLYRNSGEYFDIYHAYETSGRVLFMSAILIFILSNMHFSFPRSLYCIILIGGGVATDLFAIYQANIINFNRVELGFDRATMAAYAISIINILMINAILTFNGKIRYILYITGMALSLSAIVFTGTRAAILAYPILSIILTFFHPNVNKAHLLKLVACVLALLIIIGFAFQKELEVRAVAFKNDLVNFEKNNSKTSVGARLAMNWAGFHAGMAALEGQSAESRAINIDQQIQHDPAMAGAGVFKHVHMHNELIDNFSLRGLAGVIMLMLFYAALIYNAWQERNLVQFVVTLSLITYGLSDVIFFSREGTISYAIAILAALTFSTFEKPIGADKDNVHV